MTDRILLRPTEAAEALGISRTKLYQLVADGTIPAVRLAGGHVRIPLRELNEAIAALVAAPRD